MITDIIELAVMFALEVSAVRLLQNSILARPDEWYSPRQQWRRAVRTTLGLYAFYLLFVLLALPLFLRWAATAGWVAYTMAALAWLILTIVPVIVFRRTYGVSWWRSLRGALIWSGVSGAMTPVIFGVTRFLVGMTVERPAIMLTGYAVVATAGVLVWLRYRRQAARFAEVATGQRAVKERTTRTQAPAEGRLDLPMPDEEMQPEKAERRHVRPRVALPIAGLTIGLGLLVTYALPGRLLHAEQVELVETVRVEDVDEFAGLATQVPHEEGWHPLDGGREGSWQGRQIMVRSHTPVLRAERRAWQVFGLLVAFLAVGVAAIVWLRGELGRALLLGASLGGVALWLYGLIASGVGTPWGRAELWLLGSDGAYLQTPPLLLWMVVLATGVLLAWSPQLVRGEASRWRPVVVAVSAGAVLLTALLILGESTPLFAHCAPRGRTGGTCQDVAIAMWRGETTPWITLETTPEYLRGDPQRGTLLVHRWLFGGFNWVLLLAVGTLIAWRARFRAIGTALVGVGATLGGLVVVSVVFLGLSEGGAGPRFLQMELIVLLLGVVSGAIGVAVGYGLRGGRTRLTEWEAEASVEG